MRSVVLSVKENEYVNAAEALGASRMRILMKEIIPNSVSSVLIMATTDIGNKILMFSTLSFLGLGSAPPTPEWGMMVSDGVDYFNKFWVAGFRDLPFYYGSWRQFHRRWFKRPVRSKIKNSVLMAIFLIFPACRHAESKVAWQHYYSKVLWRRKAICKPRRHMFIT